MRIHFQCQHFFKGSQLHLLSWRITRSSKQTKKLKLKETRSMVRQHLSMPKAINPKGQKHARGSSTAINQSKKKKTTDAPKAHFLPKLHEKLVEEDSYESEHTHIFSNPEVPTPTKQKGGKSKKTVP
ncbi:uncharacterized protein LOC131607653 [Vicia villosa]|uniref:uncharacterized protein LOC131607653 n=1 Tax=Vicia villosa TaxID=3911 RepID=UPI00273C1522|nr:uncharacterized protein LOC131607653 [Vicia villosa]